MRSSLDALSDLKRYFERNGPMVDAEMREAFVRNIPKAIVTRKHRDFVEEQVSFISWEMTNSSCQRESTKVKTS